MLKLAFLCATSSTSGLNVVNLKQWKLSTEICQTRSLKPKFFFCFVLLTRRICDSFGPSMEYAGFGHHSKFDGLWPTNRPVWAALFPFRVHCKQVGEAYCSGRCLPHCTLWLLRLHLSSVSVLCLFNLLNLIPTWWRTWLPLLPLSFVLREVILTLMSKCL